MTAILVVSFDPDATKRIDEVASAAGFRIRSVNTSDAAREWLTLQSYDVVLVDSRFNNSGPLELIDFAWKQNLYTLGGLFNLDGPVEDQWSARILGARVFADQQALPQLSQFFNSLAQQRDRDLSYGVLLVEDLDSPRDIICSYIESMGYSNAVGAKSVDVALENLRQHPNSYFCVITDINMPERNGIDLITEVRRDESLMHLPILVLTAYASPENLIECIRAGATGFLVKPPRKRLLKFELQKCYRIFVTRQSPRLCRPEDAEQLEQSLDLSLR